MTTVQIGVEGPPGAHPGLVLGPANDWYEREADRVAQRVTGEAVRRSPSGCCDASVASAGTALHPRVQHAIQRSRGGGRPIPDAVRTYLEHALEADLSQVKLHTDSYADDLNRELEARAFTVGNHVFFRSGEFDPHSTIGLQVLTHELAHVLQQRAAVGRPGIVRRWIQVGNRRNQEYTVAALFDKFKVDSKQAYTDARTQGLMDDAQMIAFLTPYVTSNDQFFVAQVFGPLQTEIERRQMEATFAPTVNERGVQVQILSTEDNFPKPTTLDEQPTSVDLHASANLIMKAKLAVKVPQDQLGQWTIGITQTLMSANRRLTLVSSKGIRVATVTGLARRIDRRPTSTPPWYDNRWGLVNEFEVNEVMLDDRPGYSFDKAPAETVLSRSGRDVFKTFLILRHNSGNPVRFLFEWRWIVDYRPGREAGLIAPPTAQTAGESAVLDGARASDPGQVMTDIKSLPLSEPAEFKRVKESATKRFSPGSGMMPRKEYRQLYSEFEAHMGALEIVEAVAVLEQIKQNLNAMGQLGTEYWKSEALKKAQFDPMYKAVVDLMAELSVDVD